MNEGKEFKKIGYVLSAGSKQRKVLLRQLKGLGYHIYEDYILVEV